MEYQPEEGSVSFDFSFKSETLQKAIGVENQTISTDEGLMKKAVRSLKRIATQKTSSEQTLPMAELEEIVRQGEEDIKKGNFKIMTLDDIWK